MPDASPAGTENEIASDSAEDILKRDLEASQSDTDGNAADSSVADNEDDSLSTLDVVKKALQAEREGDGDSSGPEEDKDSSKTDAEADNSDKEDKSGESDEESSEDENLPFHKHPRWQAKQQELKDAKEELEQLRPLKEQLESTKPQVEAFEEMQTFVVENNLTGDHVNDLFAVGALIRNEPEKAIPVLERYLDACRQVAGHTLPDDLTAEVNEGRISEERARELSQSRSRQARSEAAAQAARDRAAELENQQTSQATAQEVSKAVSRWEDSWSKKDPDYDLKADRVLKEIRLIRFDRQDQLKNTPEEAVEIAQLALDTVNEEFKKLAPRRIAPTTPVPEGNSGSATTPPRPQTSADVVRMALGE